MVCWVSTPPAAASIQAAFAIEDRRLKGGKAFLGTTWMYGLPKSP